ncbi:acyl-CoA thioesterase [Terriglobus roseus]|uniref:Acyl-CoA thioester hydrolase n=1 Tax=Terriglobus roseus TaxID=392734 RepID=A0A1H4KL31_9BACT|nr:thioesterase family protein [Terriglobus roseus]SEB58818.1 acyl-CoA thioester hydrolase [Terriglobus roseus]
MPQPQTSTRFHAEARLRVRYAETDQMGVVYHANYLVWFEVGRVELMRSMGLAYSQLEKDHGLMIAVVGVEVRYRSPARYDDEVAIRTTIAAIRGPVLKMSYRVVRVADEKLLCEGTTTHVVVDRNMGKAILPPAYDAAFRALLEPADGLPL